MSELSKLSEVKLDIERLKKYFVGTADAGAKDENGDYPTCWMKLPVLKPGIVILVHGVNSEGEWYSQFDNGVCKGLHERLGYAQVRDEKWHLAANTWTPYSFNVGGVPAIDNRVMTIDSTLVTSPVIPFYWGYKSTRHTAAEAKEEFKVEYAPNASWGGGPFANGTFDLSTIFGEGTGGLVGGFAELASPFKTRYFSSTPERNYMAHAARRLANLVKTIRKSSEFGKYETITLMSHSQGTMVALLSLFYIKQEGVRGPDCVMLNNSPYGLEKTFSGSFLESWTPHNTSGQPESGRIETLRLICSMLKEWKANAPKGKWIAQNPLCGFKLQLDQKDRDADRYNHGNLNLYFSLHDRVIGSYPCQGIGWKGLSKGLHSILGDNFYQRGFARWAEVGKQGDLPFSKAEWRQERWENYKRINAGYSYTGGDEQPFWFPDKSEDKKGPAMDMSLLQDPVDGSVYCNAPNVKKPMKLTASFDAAFETQAMNTDWDAWVACMNMRYRDGKQHDLQEGYAEIFKQPATDHGAIVSNAEIIANIHAYDLPVGPCLVGEDPKYWQYLCNLADCRKSDPYYESGKVPDASKQRPADLPPDWSTIRQEQDRERA